MTISEKPFPPLIDLQDGGWPLSSPQMTAEITLRNNQIVERVATQRLELSDHIYGFALWCELDGGRAK